jgi:hypothetical protein
MLPPHYFLGNRTAPERPGRGSRGWRGWREGFTTPDVPRNRMLGGSLSYDAQTGTSATIGPVTSMGSVERAAVAVPP